MEKGEQWYLLSGKGTDVDTSKQSVYSSSVGGTDHLNGMRVRLTFTMTGTGSLAPPFITVTGLSEKELPVETCPSGVMHIEIPGLCVGAGQDLRHEAIGYVAFIRANSNSASGKTTDIRNFEFYRDEVLIPFVGLIREKVYGCNPGSAIPNELSYCCVVDRWRAVTARVYD